MGGLRGTALTVNIVTQSGLPKALGRLVLLLAAGAVGFALGTHAWPGAAEPGAADIGFSQDMVMHHTAQQGYQQAVAALVQARTSRYTDTAALYQAIGGGWWQAPRQAGNT